MGAVNERHFLHTFINRLKDQYLQDWTGAVNSSPKLNTYYNKFKQSFSYEKYLDVLNVRKFRYIYSSFRSSSHDLEIERGRYANIDRCQRLCTLCNLRVVEDEYHFLLCCGAYKDLRELYLPNKYYVYPSVHKFIILLATQNDVLIRTVASYLHYAFKRRKELQLEN